MKKCLMIIALFGSTHCMVTTHKTIKMKPVENIRANLRNSGWSEFDQKTQLSESLGGKEMAPEEVISKVHKAFRKNIDSSGRKNKVDQHEWDLIIGNQPNLMDAIFYDNFEGLLLMIDSDSAFADSTDFSQGC